MKNNEIISNIFKTLVIILGLIGIFCFNVKNGDLATNFFYYTILTNTVCIISAAFFLYKDLLHKKYSVSRENRLNIYKYIITVSIFVVAFTFNFIIFPTAGFSLTTYGYKNLLLHCLVPILYIVDWLLFAKKDNLSFKSISYTLIPFILYLVLIYGRAFIFKTRIFMGLDVKTPSLYPYFFLDYSRIGFGNFIAFMFVSFIVIVIVGIILLKVGKIINKKKDSLIVDY
ncbi:MAG: Pr6Pr family membrane protein [Methanobacteriaceae archaeon]|nr:Pr6Pr family membrane protein [Methanobacteriaceae archaeon]